MAPGTVTLRCSKESVCKILRTTHFEYNGEVILVDASGNSVMSVEAAQHFMKSSDSWTLVSGSLPGGKPAARKKSKNKKKLTSSS